MPEINIKPPFPFAVLAGLIVLSYFTHIGWWAWSGITFVVSSLFADEKKYEPLMYVFIFISLILFILGIFATDWIY